MNYYDMLLARKLAKGELPPNAYLLKEASSSLVSFSDGADLPMPSFICNIDAVQDLHGYDAPWVGGAGKNKLPLVLSDIKSGNLNGTWSGNTYTLNGVTFEVLTDSAGTEIGVKVDGTASATTTFLIAWGVNLAPMIDKSIILNGSPNIEGIRLQWYNYDGNNGTVIDRGAGTSAFTPVTVTNANVALIVSSGYTINNQIVKPMVRLATETDATFAPYSNICPISGHTGVEANVSPTTEASAGTTYSVSWQTEAGEVFGGYVDLVSGVLTVTHAGVDLGSLTWIKDSSANNSRYVAQRSGIKSNSTIISDIFKPATYSEVYYHRVDEAIATHDTYAQIVIHSSTFEAEYDADGFKTQMSGHSAVYELATPITYQLTPTQIKSLLGNNNAWCSTGDVTLEYFGKGDA